MKHNSFPYNDKEWEQIVEDAFAPDAEPHVFSRQYQQKKSRMNTQMEVTKMKKHNFHMKKPITAAVAIAAAVVLVPSTAFAVSHFSAYFQKTGAYQQNVVIENGSETSASTQPMALSVGWMPEGMEYVEQDGKYGDAQGRGVTMLYWKMNSANEALTHQISYTISQETYTCGENTVLCAKRDTTGMSGTVFDREIWVAFPDSSYAVEMYVTSDVTEDEVKQIAAQLSLTPADTETATVWTEDTEKEEPAEIEDVNPAPEDIQIFQIGDTIKNSDYYETESAVSVSVDSVSVQDTFDGITTDGCGNPANYADYTKADGTVADSVRKWYTMGDGVNTLDEQTQEETVPQKVLVMHLTYTNIGSETVEECVCPSLFWFENGKVLYDWDAAGTYSTDSNLELKYDNMAFSFSTDHSFHKNNLTDLAPGESAEVTLAFLVDAYKMDNLYLNILNIGSPAIALSDLQ